MYDILVISFNIVGTVVVVGAVLGSIVAITTTVIDIMRPPGAKKGFENE